MTFLIAKRIFTCTQNALVLTRTRTRSLSLSLSLSQSQLYINTYQSRICRRIHNSLCIKMEQQKQKFSQFKGQPRLPKFAIPKRYDLKLKPDLTACNFTGAVDISMDVVSDTQFLILNAAELSVIPDSVKFTSNDKVIAKAKCPPLIISNNVEFSFSYLFHLDLI